MHNPNTPKEIVNLCGHIVSFGAVSFSSFFLWFVFILTQKKRILKTKFFYLILFIFPLFFIYKQFTGFMVVSHVKMAYGWSNVWSKSIWPYLFYLYYLSFMGMGLYLLYKFSRKTENALKKKQAKIIFVTVLISLLIGSITNVLLPRLHIWNIPEVANITALIWAAGMAYVIVKYKFLIITPAMAADNIISTMSDALILLNQKGIITTVNKATLDLLKYQKNELEGESVKIIFEEEDFKNIFLDKILKGECLKNYELVFKEKKGQNVPVIFSTSMLRDQLGNVAGIVCVATDISERKQAEQRLRETQDKLIKSEKLAVVSQIAAEVAHEIRNPLSVIKNSAYLLSKIIKEEEVKLRENVARIERATERASKFVDDLLYLSRPTILKFQMTSLQDILKEVIKEKSYDLQKIRIKTMLAPNLPKIKLDILCLKQALNNIFANFIETMPKGGELTISSAFNSDREIIEIKIENAGEPILEEDIPKLSDSLYITEHKEVELGLSISKKIIEDHQGSIEVKNQGLGGTTFIIQLPANPQ